MCQEGDLLLEDEEPVSLLGDLLDEFVTIRDFIWIVLCTNIKIVYLGTQRSRAIDRSNS